MKSMKIRIISISNKCPVWISQGIDHFLTKFPQNIRPELIEIRSIKKNRDASKCLMEEKQKIMDRVDPVNQLVVLDEKGKSLTSTGFAQRLDNWMVQGKTVDLVIGGADGLHESLKSDADELISLSKLTLPHQMARLFLIEALYRASAILANHPYHRS